MPLDAVWLPLATPLDPAEEPPGSLDPLGTLIHAERFAEALLPGFTVRMWRSRLLTFATLAAYIADRTVALMGGREDVRLDARLAFERLFVSAVVRLTEREPTEYARAALGVPGRTLAKKALGSGEPVTRANFLKGQAVNGPFGVIARLARQLELIDDDGRSGRNAVGLIMAWADDEGLPGVLDDDDHAMRRGAGWVEDAVRRTAAAVSNRDWPGSGHRIWEQLARNLRPDHIGSKERRMLLVMLETTLVRRRMLGILKERVDVYRTAWRAGDRGQVERSVLLNGVRPRLGDDPIDRLIADVITAIDAYERTVGLLQQAFEGLIWGLKGRGGRALPEIVLGDVRLHRHLERTRTRLAEAVPLLERAAERLRDQPSVDPPRFIEPLLSLREDAAAGGVSVAALADSVLRRHERVQREKAKAPWIERESHWTLMPGENRVSVDAPPVWQDTYLHPLKIPNAYSILGDLGQVNVEDRSAED